MTFCSIILILIGVVSLAVQEAYADRLYGLERMERFDLLPQMLEGTQVRQVSSHDRSGGNDDGFIGTYSALYIDKNGEYVLFDEIGAGCLYRFWMTYGNSPSDYPNYRLKFYYDNEPIARLDLSIVDFFDGVGAPLEFPMVGPFNKSSHGCYCYLPFPYRERLKITLSGKPLFYNMTYHRFDSSEGVDSWEGTEDRSGVMELWSQSGNDPKPTDYNQTISSNLTLSAGATGTLFSVIGSGAVQSIKLDPSPATEEILSKVWVQMNWDGGEAEVDVPLGDFFGSGKNEINMTSLPIGMKTSGDWYCYFPMPYWDSAEIRLVNKGREAVTTLPFTIQYTTNNYDKAKAGYFNVAFHESSFESDGADFNFIDESGRGHLVGVSLFMESSGAGGYKDMNYLEGDERAYVDGSLSPCIHGTGNEDYFNCGWYFNQGTFSRPYHGHPWQDQFNGGGTNYTQAYRLHLSDVIPFEKSIKFGVEHGPANASPGTYSSITYFYKVGGSASGLALMADLDSGNSWTESVYSYSAASNTVPVSNVWKYEGDNDQSVPDTGYAYTGSVTRFTVPLVDNIGLLLRRRCDQGVGGQKADVFVDEVYAGIWYEADHNFFGIVNRWLDSEFMIVSNLVAGKASVQISIVPQGSSIPWNEYRYQLYCIKPLRLVVDSDKDQLPDEWELDWVSTLGTLSGSNDWDSDGFSDLNEYIAGTCPTNAAAFPLIQSAAQDYGVSVQTHKERVYHLQTCDNLISNDWKTIRASIPGNGENMSVPFPTNTDSAYHRILIENP